MSISNNPISGAPISSLGYSGLFQNVLHSLSLSDSLVQNMEWARSLDSTLSLSQVVGLETILNLSLSDSLTLSHTPVGNFVFQVSPSSTFTMSQDMDMDFIARTDITANLDLSQTVLLNVNYGFTFEEELILGDLLLRDLEVSASDTITFTHEAVKVDVNVAGISTLVLTHSVFSTNVYNRSLSDSFTMSDLIQRHVNVTLSDTLAFTSSNSNRVLPFLSTSDILGLSHAVGFINNLDMYVGDTLSLAQILDTRNLAQQNVTDILLMFHIMSNTLFPAQRLTQDLTLVGYVTELMLPQINAVSILTVAQTVYDRLLQQQNDSNSIQFSQAVNATVFRRAEQRPTQSVQLTHAVSINRVINTAMCDCLDLESAAFKAIPLDVSNTLSLSAAIGFEQPTDTLNLSHEVAINAQFDPCCGRVFVSGKWGASTMVLNQALLLNRDFGVSLSSNLNLLHTAVYFKL